MHSRRGLNSRIFFVGADLHAPPSTQTPKPTISVLLQPHPSAPLTSFIPLPFCLKSLTEQAPIPSNAPTKGGHVPGNNATSDLLIFLLHSLEWVFFLPGVKPHNSAILPPLNKRFTPPFAKIFAPCGRPFSLYHPLHPDVRLQCPISDKWFLGRTDRIVVILCLFSATCTHPY